MNSPARSDASPSSGRRPSAAAPHAPSSHGLPDERWFEIRASGIQGQGGFALRPIPAGTTIIEYTGERIDGGEADRRYEEELARGRHHTFMFIVDDDTVIDASRGGNEARLINHSCDPNCETYEDGGRIFIAALRDIAAGEELTYDYEYDLDDEDVPRARELYPCHCGAATCRGTMYKPD